jgi:uncharacterized protein YdaU (DUF1376 family)
MSFDWHARHHQAALDGMLSLTLEERGAYNTLLDLIYSRAGPIPDDERWLAGWMGCSVKKWRLLRSTLLVKGKIHETDHAGQAALMNARAVLEIQSASTRRRVAAESGASGGRKTAQKKTKPKENNDEGQATLGGSLKLRQGQDIDSSSVAKATAQSALKVEAVTPQDREEQDPDTQAWALAVTVLTHSGLTDRQARGFFGGLLKRHGIKASEMLIPLIHCEDAGTLDAQAYLAQAAQNLITRRQAHDRPDQNRNPRDDRLRSMLAGAVAAADG